jgi:hypothetical protein
MESLASRKRSRPRQPKESSINIGCQSSFGTHNSQSQKFSSAQVWRAAVAAVIATCNFGLSGLDFLISLGYLCLVH